MIRLLIACLATLLVSSCLDSHEEVWLNADASGKARVQLSLPLSAVAANGGEQGIRTIITEYFEATPAFTSHTLATKVKEDQLEIDVFMTFDNAFELQVATSGPSFQELPETARDLLGKVEVKIQGRNLNLHRSIDLTKTFPGSAFIPGDQLKDHKLITIIHLPKAASSHNAHAAEDSGKTLIWTTPVASAFREPVNQIFTMEIPLPWLKICLMALAVVLVGGLAYYFVCRRMRMRVV